MTPKQTLLEAAAENPGGILLTTFTNGEIKCSIQYQDPAQAQYMLFILTEKLRALMLKGMPAMIE